MIKPRNFSKLYRQRLEGLITREAYWSQVRDFLEILSDFSEFQEILGNEVEISGSKIIVRMKISKTHPSYIQMFLDSQDIRSVPFMALTDGYYEPFQSDILVELGKKSHHFFDIGANMGFYSIALASENPQLKVESFEPQPHVFDLLSANVSLNQVSSQIKLDNIGLGNSKDELTMYIPKFTGTGGGSFMNLHSEEGEATQIKVCVNLLDNVAKTQPDLIKIDVEGNELNVILGARKIICASKPTIVVELLRKWMKPFGHTPQMFLNFLIELGYTCLAISEDQLTETLKIDENTKETNFIFVHNSQEKHKAVLASFEK